MDRTKADWISTGLGVLLVGGAIYYVNKWAKEEEVKSIIDYDTYIVKRRDDEMNRLKDLLERGVNPNVHTYCGKSLLTKSLELRDERKIQLLVDYGRKLRCTVDNISSTLRYGLDYIAERMIDRKRIYRVDMDSLLEMAAHKECTRSFHTLRSRGAQLRLNPDQIYHTISTTNSTFGADILNAAENVHGGSLKCTLENMATEKGDYQMNRFLQEYYRK